MWQRELLGKGMKKESVLALERFTESGSFQKIPAKEQSTDTPIKRDVRTALYSSSGTAVLSVLFSELGGRVKGFIFLTDLRLLPNLLLVVVLNRSTSFDDLHRLLILPKYLDLILPYLIFSCLCHLPARFQKFETLWDEPSAA